MKAFEVLDEILLDAASAVAVLFNWLTGKDHLCLARLILWWGWMLSFWCAWMATRESSTQYKAWMLAESVLLVLWLGSRARETIRIAESLRDREAKANVAFLRRGDPNLRGRRGSALILSIYALVVAQLLVRFQHSEEVNQAFSQASFIAVCLWLCWISYTASVDDPPHRKSQISTLFATAKPRLEQSL